MMGFFKHLISMVFFVTDGGEQNYLKSIEVMVMLDTLRVIDNPLNDYALVALLRSPMFSFDEDELTRLSSKSWRKTQAKSLWKLQNAHVNRGEHAQLVNRNLQEKLTAFFWNLYHGVLFAKTHALYDLILEKYIMIKFYYDYVGSLPKADQRASQLICSKIESWQFWTLGI